MEKELTPQQELFCEKYLECKRNASEAYRQSYNCEGSSPQVVWNEAYKLMRNPDVAIRIKELFDYHADRHNCRVDTITEEYEEIRRASMRSGDYSPAVAAVTGKAKLHGLIVDKNEHTGKDGKPLTAPVIIAATSEAIRDELKKIHEEF